MPGTDDTKKQKPSVWWSIGFWAIVGIGLFSFLFHIAGITIIPLPLIKLPAERVDDSVRGQVIAAAVTWLGGIGALCTFLLNREQKDRLQKEQLEEARIIEDARTLKEREFETQREKRERDLAELQRLESEFAALVKDFASESVLARINAAIGLRELAIRPDPRRVSPRTSKPDLDDQRYSDQGTLLITSRGTLDTKLHWPSEWRTEKCTRNYPYFLRACWRLVAALSYWNEDECKELVVDTLRDLCKWARSPGTDEPLLHELVQLIANQQKRSYNELQRTAVHMSESASPELFFSCTISLISELQDEYFSHYLTFDQFDIASRDFTAALLNSEYSYSIVVERTPILKPARDAECDGTPIAKTLRNYHHCTQVLCYALQQFSSPPECSSISTDIYKLNDPTLDQFRDSLRSRRNLDLSNVKIFGGNLSEANLQGINGPGLTIMHSMADLTSFHYSSIAGAHFIGVHGDSMQLVAAECEYATFKNARTTSASFVKTRCNYATFLKWEGHRVNFSFASLCGATLSGLTFGTAQSGCNFQAANLLDAELSGAVFGRSNLQSTKLSGSQIGDEGNSASFAAANWSEADFRSYGDIENPGPPETAQEYDYHLWYALDRRFPLPGGEKRTAPWEKPDSPSA